MRILQFVRNPQEKVDKIVIEKYYEVFANLLFTTRREDQMKGHEWVTNGEEGTRGLRCFFFSPPPLKVPLKLIRKFFKRFESEKVNSCIRHRQQWRWASFHSRLLSPTTRRKNLKCSVWWRLTDQENWQIDHRWRGSLSWIWRQSVF